MAAIAAQLIGGSGTRFHHSKINSKLPHTATQVKWHQDFLFTPHSNDDIITALLMVSDVTPENGPLNVVPGAIRGRCGPTGRTDALPARWTTRLSATASSRRPVLARRARCALCIPACFTPPAPMKPTAADAVYQRLRAEDALPFGENPLPSRTPASWWPGKRAAWCAAPPISYACRKTARRIIFRSAGRPRSRQHVISSWRFYETI
jgi:hypothetical protein